MNESYKAYVLFITIKKKECRTMFTLTCGMYPILDPGIPHPFVPGTTFRTLSSPEFSFRSPPIHARTVVLPQPLAPNKP